MKNYKLTDEQKEILKRMYNKQGNVNNLVTFQIHFKQKSEESKICKSLEKLDLVEWVGTGLRFAVSYPTEKGFNLCKELFKDYKIKLDAGVYINDTLINEDIFQEEKVDYIIVEREQQINNLYMWIREATGSDRQNDLYLMKEDLRYLESLRDEFIFSSISTNEFIAKSDDEENFNSICEEILKLNGEKENE